MAALVNGLTLLAIAGWIAIEAVRRLAAPIEVESGMMLAAAGLAVNIAAFTILNGGDCET